ncbi:hypothetical protein KJ644_03075 [Candidatus Dependentiae bacterium]|nr:hypothetical protein [Candidatus Dependentiae bacterium]MBU4387428.1 hypothetical protein [Candidatus Dependentiae bacterium]MCG2756753.1 hypothetical protein [Candidatus Dependentiae bacterium]
MLNKLVEKILSLWNVKKEYRLKVFFLSLTFLFMSATQAIWRPLKNAIFAKTVGAIYVPDAKIYSLIFLIPLLLFYSKLVDWLRRHQLLYAFLIFHAIGCLVLYAFLIHPVYGLENTSIGVHRFVGWGMYFFMESFAAFMSMSFWSFADSINNPSDAKNYYGLFVAGSKIGSMITAGLLYLATNSISVSQDHIVLPKFLLIGCILLLCAAVSIYFMMKYVPGYHMHGYEAVYQLEKAKEKEAEKEAFSFKNMLKKPFEGLIVMIKNPYVLGIFGLVLFYEVTIVIVEYIVQIAADASHESAGSLTAYFASYYFIMNLVGLFITLFGTTPLLRLLGINKTLYIFPIITIGLIVLTIFNPSASMLFIDLVALRSLNYALNHPTREILYIPTTKAIKFKAKAWTDAFGGRFSKGIGSSLNIVMRKLAPVSFLMANLVVILGLMGCWLAVIPFLGNKLKKVVDEKKVIGEDVN